MNFWLFAIKRWPSSVNNSMRRFAHSWQAVVVSAIDCEAVSLEEKSDARVASDCMRRANFGWPREFLRRGLIGSRQVLQNASLPSWQSPAELDLVTIASLLSLVLPSGS
jgi:hypothetical protein